MALLTICPECGMGHYGAHDQNVCELQQLGTTFCWTCGYYEGTSDDVAHDNLCCGGTGDWCRDTPKEPPFPDGTPYTCMGHVYRKTEREVWQDLTPGDFVRVEQPIRDHATLTLLRYWATVDIVVLKRDQLGAAIKEVTLTNTTGIAETHVVYPTPGFMTTRLTDKQKETLSTEPNVVLGF